MASSATIVTRGGAHTESDEAVTEAMQNFENVHSNYVAIINPNTGRAMLHLKKFGDCTLIDPRACIHHYHCTADVACVLYAPVSLRYFHYMVASGYISNKTRVVLNDTTNDTYVFVVAENKYQRGGPESNTVEAIIRNVQRQEGQFRVGIDVLQPGTKDEVGYFFHQPTSYFRAGGHMRATTTMVMNREMWNRRLRSEKQQFDCQRRHHNEQLREEIAGGCRAYNTKDNAASKNKKLQILHVPTLMIQHPKFGIPPPQNPNGLMTGTLQ